MSSLISRSPNAARRSALSLLFVVLAVVGSATNVHASGVGASGTFAGTNYQVEPGESLINTNTTFSFINNFDVPITVDFVFEAPQGVSINVPSGLITIAAGSSYRFDVNIFTLNTVTEGTFPIQITGLVIPDAASGVEVSGSAGLNALLTIQGKPPTQSPSVVLVSRTDTSIVVRLTNEDFENVLILYDLLINPPTTASPDLGPQSGIVVTFSGLEPNTIYTVFVTAKATGRDESSLVSFEVTTLPTPVVVPEPEDDPEVPPPPVVVPVIPPAQPAPTPPPPVIGGGGSSLTNVVIIELSSQLIEVPVFGTYIPPIINAYVSIRSANRETSRIDLTDRVVIVGGVNTSVLGRYEIRYRVRYNTTTAEEIVIVNVRDRIAPRITSAEEVTFLVNQPFQYQLIATDNYSPFERLIITGLPANVDTSRVGTQRFSVVVTDESGNRTPFLFTVNVRERIVSPVVVSIGEIDVEFLTTEGEFDASSFRTEVSVSANQPLRNSPTWTLYTGQPLTQGVFDLVYVRITDAQGNFLIVAVDITEGRVIPLDPDANIISGDAWWRVLLRTSNLLLWVGPLLLVLGAWAWFFYFIAKRRRTYIVVFVVAGIEISSQKVPHGTSAEEPSAGPWNLPFDRVTSDMRITRIESVAMVPTKRPRPVKPVVEVIKPIRVRQVVEKIPMIEPILQEESVKQVAKPKAPRKPRKLKLEQYAQLVALEENGVMDDDTLGLELLDLAQRTPKDVIDIDLETATKVASKVDKGQIDLFEQNEITPTKKRKKSRLK